MKSKMKIGNVRTVSVAIIVLCILAMVIKLELAKSPHLQFSASLRTQPIKVALFLDTNSQYIVGQPNYPSASFPLFDQIALAEHWQVEYVPCHWRECYTRLLNGELDILPDVAYSEERAMILSFHSIPMGDSWSQIYSSTFSGIRQWENLENKKIATLNGSIQQQVFPKIMSELGITYTSVSVDDITKLFTAVQDGIADASAFDHFYGLKNLSDSDLIATPITFNQAAFYFAAPKGKNAEILSTIDDYILRWTQDPDSPYFQLMRDHAIVSKKNTTPRWLIVTFISLLVISIGFLLMIMYLRMINRRNKALIQTSLHRFHYLAECNGAIVFRIRNSLLSPDWISDNTVDLLGYKEDTLLNSKNWITIIDPDDVNQVKEARQRLTLDHSLSHQFRITDAHGKTRYIREELRWFPQTQSGNEIVGIWIDLSVVREQEEKVHYLENFDALTGLPNRTLLSNHLDDLTQQSKEESDFFSLVCIKIDRFSAINESFGPSMSERVLTKFVSIVDDLFAKRIFFARTGTNEFYLIVPNQASPETITRELQSLLNALKEPLSINDRHLHLSVSLGVCHYPQHGNDVSTLLLHAEQAMLEAYRLGGNVWETYFPELTTRTNQRFIIENSLLRGEDFSNFTIYYQPQIDLLDNTLLGAEALVYWQHEELGLLTPNDFVPIAEEIGVIEKIDEWVLHTTCQQIGAWEQLGLIVPKVAVNISACECTNVALVNRVSDALAANQISAARIEIEITESMLMGCQKSASEILGTIRKLGVSIAMDDFGTAYANLSQLGQIPIDRLKIDKSFTQLIPTSLNSQTLLKSIIAMGRALQLEIIIEGIETEEQARFLRNEGCRIGQGYLFSRPLTANAFIEKYGFSLSTV